MTQDRFDASGWAALTDEQMIGITLRPSGSDVVAAPAEMTRRLAVEL